MEDRPKTSQEAAVFNMLKFTFVLFVSFVGLALFSDNAAAQTVSAKGSVTVFGLSCNFNEPNVADQCHAGGSGARIGFSFQGVIVDPLSALVPASGSFSAYYPDTGLKVTLVVGTAFINPAMHFVQFTGTCETRDALGQLVPFGTGGCSGFAEDATPNGAVDTISVSVTTSSGFIQASGEPASGNINID